MANTDPVPKDGQEIKTYCLNCKEDTKSTCLGVSKGQWDTYYDRTVKCNQCGYSRNINFQGDR